MMELKVRQTAVLKGDRTEGATDSGTEGATDGGTNDTDS